MGFSMTKITDFKPRNKLIGLFALLMLCQQQETRAEMIIGTG